MTDEKELWLDLTEEKTNDVDESKYIKPNIETQLSVNKRQDCRDVVLEIKKFGVSQRQILYLIYLLALELEDVQLMKEITTVIGQNRDKVPVIETSTPKLDLGT